VIRLANCGYQDKYCNREQATERLEFGRVLHGRRFREVRTLSSSVWCSVFAAASNLSEIVEPYTYIIKRLRTYCIMVNATLIRRFVDPIQTGINYDKIWELVFHRTLLTIRTTSLKISHNRLRVTSFQPSSIVINPEYYFYRDNWHTTAYNEYCNFLYSLDRKSLPVPRCKNIPPIFTFKEKNQDLEYTDFLIFVLLSSLSFCS